MRRHDDTTDDFANEFGIHSPAPFGRCATSVCAKLLLRFLCRLFFFFYAASSSSALTHLFGNGLIHPRSPSLAAQILKILSCFAALRAVSLFPRASYRFSRRRRRFYSCLLFFVYYGVYSLYTAETPVLGNSSR